MKFFGVILDENLTFRYHINFLRRKFFKLACILNKLKFILPNEICLKLYKSFIELYNHYGLIVWFSTSKNLTNRFFVLQKKLSELSDFFTVQPFTTQSSSNP